MLLDSHVDLLTEWARSGLMDLTGAPGGRPDPSRARFLVGVTAQLRTLDIECRRAGGQDRGPQTADKIMAWAQSLLGDRAAMRSLTRNGQVSAGGASRLLRCMDGWIALTLARADDQDSVPALVGNESPAPVWDAVSEWALGQSAEAAVERGVLFGMPVARLGEANASLGEHTRIAVAANTRLAGALVVDLSSMWAGPLCGKLLHEAGATVIKVESPARPDGSRSGDARFFDSVNSGKLSASVEFRPGSKELGLLLSAADIVIEASRPRVLEELGMSVNNFVHRPGKVWIRITGHGHRGPAASRIAFGDDAAVAGGLVGEDGYGDPVFCGDALADPLTGIAAAVAAARSMARGGGEMVDLNMASVAAHHHHESRRLDGYPVEPANGGGWTVATPGRGHCRVDPARLRGAVGRPGPRLGADTATALRLARRRLSMDQGFGPGS